MDVLIRHSRTLAVKLGAKGSVGIQKGKEIIYKKGYAVKPIDTTGSGDSFNAGFIYGYLNRYGLDKSLELGNACGAISTTKIGGASSFARLEEVMSFIDSYNG